jgi:hypothetical protein
MEVTRDIVIDLIPLYQSGEASPDTRAAVEALAARDPSLARLLKGGAAEPAAAAPPPDLERQAVSRTRTLIQRRSWALGLALACTLVPFSFVFRDGQTTFFLFRDAPASRVLLLAAVMLWVWYAKLTWKLREGGL